MTIDLSDCQQRDDNDDLAVAARQYSLPEAVIYLDGNSLGAMPKRLPAVIDATLQDEWSADLIGAWNSAGWAQLSQTLGDRIGELIGAAAGQTIVCDNTSVNLFKLIHAAASIASAGKNLLCLESEFPTDLYMIESVVSMLGRDWKSIRVDAENLEQAIEDYPGVVVLSQVNYRNGELYPIDRITDAAHRAGSLVIWDLCHSAGVMPIELDANRVDFAVGCSYKFLNGGPGAPAFLYAAKRHIEHCQQPLAGWWSHADPFAFDRDYQPASDIRRFLSGTQSVLAMKAVAAGLDSYSGWSLLAIRQKSVALCELFVQLLRQECAEFDLRVLGDDKRQGYGSHVSVEFEQGYALMQALIASGVIGDFRAPNIMRFGFAPLYNGFEDVWHAVECLKACLQQASWREPRFQQKQQVT